MPGAREQIRVQTAKPSADSDRGSWGAILSRADRIFGRAISTCLLAHGLGIGGVVRVHPAV